MIALPSLWQGGAKGDNLISSKISFKEEFDNCCHGVSLASKEVGVVYS
jgi:hypothetical protein